MQERREEPSSISNRLKRTDSMSPRRKANNIASVTAIHEDATFPEPSEESSEERAAPVVQPVAAKPVRQATRLPAQRRVSSEVVKAETRLLSLERRRQESVANHDAVWSSKRAALLASFPDDVHRALVAMGVLVEDEDLAEPAE
jgi:hypothetical protein